MKIAIVGAEENKWKKEQKEKAIQLIDALLNFAVDGKLFLSPFHFTKTNTGYAVEGDTKKIDNNIILISGHSPKGGVDIWAENIAEELGIKTEIYAPEVNQWEDIIRKIPFNKNEVEEHKINTTELEFNGYYYYQIYRQRGYKSRNIQIAEACDILYDIEPAHSCKYCKGRGKIVGGGMLLGEGSSIQKCKFCEGDGAYSGGTWVYKYIKEKFPSKEAHKIIIR